MLDVNATSNPTNAQNSMVMYNPSAIASIENYAKSLHASGLLPSTVKTWQATFAIITLGSELGLGAWQAINGIDVISNKPTIKPALMLALIERSGKLEDIKIDGDDTQCTVTMKRVGRSAHTETFTMKDADRMMTSEWVNNQKREIPLSQKANWRSMPKQMLKWRAVSACARVLFSDIIMGLYTPDEIADASITINADGAVIQPIDVTPQRHVVETNLGKGSNRRINTAEKQPQAEPEVIEAEYTESAPQPQPQAEPEVKWPHMSLVDKIVAKVNEVYPTVDLSTTGLATILGIENTLVGWGKFESGKSAYNMACDKLDAIKAEAQAEEIAEAQTPKQESAKPVLPQMDMLKLGMLIKDHTGASDEEALKVLGMDSWHFENVNQAFVSFRNAWLKASKPFLTRKVIYTKSGTKSYVDYILGEYNGSSIKVRAFSRQELRDFSPELSTWVETAMKEGENTLPLGVVVNYTADDAGNLKLKGLSDIPF